MKARITLLFILAGAVFTSLYAQKAEADVVIQGDKMPSFSLLSTANTKIESTNLKGKVVLINIFATWCGPCQIELKEIENDLWPKYKDNPNFVMLVVGREHTVEQLIHYNKKKNFSFPLYQDPNREFTNKFATSMIPRSYLIDKNGTIIFASTGFDQEVYAKLLNLIDKTLN